MTMNSSRLAQSPRVALHVKTSHTDSEEERTLPMAHGHGRRLIQMIFRSNNEEDTPSSVSGGTGMVVMSPITLPNDSRSEDEVPVGRNRLSALKRKLFPSRKRRHPARIPPLVVSPITVGPQTTDVSANNIHDELPNHSFRSQQERTTHKDSSAFEPAIIDDSELDDFDFDDDLVDAIEAADRLQSAPSDETLAEMSRAIDGLHQWKLAHELATTTALKEIEEKLKRELIAAKATSEDNSDDIALAGEAERNQRLAETARERLVKTLKETEESLATENSPDEQIARVLFEAERQSANDHVDQVNSAEVLLSKLRGDIFDLGVKELSASIHATLLKELSDAENELDTKFADVEAFASDLDHVLAQFDTASTFAEQQNPAGQAAQEH